MFLDERLRKTVSFIVASRRTGREEVGTVFFICKALDDSDEGEGGDRTAIPSHHATYAVTTRHIFLNNKGSDFFIRINTTDGSFEDVRTLPDDWKYIPGNDVCVCNLSILLSEYEINLDGRLYLQAHLFSKLATDEYMKGIPVAEGYEVFILGLFIGHSGKKQAQPILRFGNIALMPHEKVEIHLSKEDVGEGKYTEIDAYLIESRSLVDDHRSFDRCSNAR